MRRPTVILIAVGASLILFASGYMLGRFQQRLSWACERPDWPPIDDITVIRTVTYLDAESGTAREWKRPILEEGPGAEMRYEMRLERFRLACGCLLEASPVTTTSCTFEPSGYIELQLADGSSMKVWTHRGSYLSFIQNGKRFCMTYDHETFWREHSWQEPTTVKR